MERKRTEKLSKQIEKKHKNEENQPSESATYEGTDRTVSTGSTLLDLAISGGRFKYGGMPTGILVEIFGPSGTGKTVLLCQIAGNIQKVNGQIMFHDPEARLNKQFARIFGFEPSDIEYTIPNTVPEVFSSVREWVPDEEREKGPYLICADSLAALSTDMELDKEEGDKMGMRRAKEFSEELRKTCRIITQRDVLMVCSNQIRQNLDAGPYGARYISPGGEALGFYSSLRLRCRPPQKVKVKRKIRGKDHERVVGIKTDIEVFKSSVWKPHHEAEIYILYDYGIDDIRGNLRFLKTSTANTVYQVGDQKLGKSIDQAIRTVEEEGLEQELKDEVVEVWNEIESAFVEKRKPKEG